MLFRKQIKSVPDIRTKIGKVIRVDNGLLDVMTIGGSAPLKGIKSSGGTPNVGDAVLVSYYKNGEVVATPDNGNTGSSGGGTTIVSSPTYVNQAGTFVAGLGLETNGSGTTNVVITSGRTQITGNGVDVSTSLLPSPTISEKGHFFVASGVGNAGWSRRIYMPDDDTLVIQNHSLLPVITLDALDGAEFSLPMTLGANGGIWQGTGTFASPTTGLKIWNDAGLGRIAGYNTGALQWYAGTDGKLYAGAGTVKIDSTGIKITSGVDLKLWIDTSGRIISYLTGGPVKSTLDSSDLKFTMQFTGYHGILWINDLTTTSAIGEDWDNGAFRIASTPPIYFTSPSDFGVKNPIHFADANFYGATSGSIQMIAPAVAGTQILTLPAATGTVALTSNITSAISGTTGTIPKFTGTNAIGNSILTESGTLVTSSGGLKATTTLNAGSGSNRNTAYSLDIKAADLALATPTGSWAFNYSWGGPSNDGYQQKVRIWAYKVVGGRQIFSAGYLELSGVDNGAGGSLYHMDVTLNPVTGADGYYIRLIDEAWGYGTGMTGYYWYSTTTGTFVYDIGNSEWDGEPLTYNMPEIPVTPSAAYMDIIAGNYSLQHRGPLLLAGLTSGQINLWPPDVAGNNIIYLPASSGTLALLSDIPTNHTGTGTSGKIVKWTGALSQGDSILSESGSALTIDGSAMLTLTTEQMRWRYDTSNWVALTIGSSGLPSFAYSTSTPSWNWGYTNFKFKQETTPAGPTAADSGVAGNPNGTYRYKVTLNTAQGNTGWYANLSNSITVTSKKIDLTGIPTGTSGVVTSRSIYRNANGLGVYKFVATINDNTTTTYQDNTADASLGGAIGAFNTTGGKFSTGPSGTTDVMWLHQAGVVVSGLTIGAGSLPGGYFTFPYSQNIQSMNSTGDGYVNVLGVGASGINFGAGFSMGNQGITNLYSLSFYATGRISTAAGGGNYDMELNNNAGGTGKLKWFGGSGTYHMNILDNAGGGYAGFGSNLTPTSRLHVDGSFATTGTAKSANFTVDANASAYYVTTGSAADITATLVAASTCNGREYIFVKVDSGTKDIVITRAGSDTINGATTLNVGTAQWSRVIIKSDGTNWVRIA